jgi:integrase
VRVLHGALPSMHSFRHAVASRALAAGESIDEVAFLLGHRDANLTRAPSMCVSWPTRGGGRCAAHA